MATTQTEAVKKEDKPTLEELLTDFHRECTKKFQDVLSSFHASKAFSLEETIATADTFNNLLHLSPEKLTKAIKEKIPGDDIYSKLFQTSLTENINSARLSAMFLQLHKVSGADSINAPKIYFQPNELSEQAKLCAATPALSSTLFLELYMKSNYKSNGYGQMTVYIEQTLKNELIKIAAESHNKAACQVLIKYKLTFGEVAYDAWGNSPKKNELSWFGRTGKQFAKQAQPTSGGDAARQMLYQANKRLDGIRNKLQEFSKSEIDSNDRNTKIEKINYRAVPKLNPN